MPLENVNNALVNDDVQVRPVQASVDFWQKIFGSGGTDPLQVNFTYAAGETPISEIAGDPVTWMTSLIVAKLNRDGQPFTLDFSGHAMDYATVNKFYQAAYNGVHEGTYVATGLTLKINGGTNDPGDTAIAAAAVAQGWIVLHN